MVLIQNSNDELVYQYIITFMKRQNHGIGIENVDVYESNKNYKDLDSNTHYNSLSELRG